MSSRSRTSSLTALLPSGSRDGFGPVAGRHAAARPATGPRASSEGSALVVALRDGVAVLVDDAVRVGLVGAGRGRLLRHRRRTLGVAAAQSSVLADSRVFLG